LSLLAQIQAVRSNAGLWMRRDHTVVRFSGADAGTWLHNQTTNDVTGLASGEGSQQALVNRQGRLQCIFDLFRFEDEYWAIIETAQLPALTQRYETHHFLEEATMEDVGQSAGQVLVEGPHAALFLGNFLDPQPELGEPGLPSAPYRFAPVTIAGHDVLAFRIAESGGDGYLLIAAPGEEAALYETLAAEGAIYGVPEVEEPARNTLMMEAGLPRFGRDWDDSTVIAETPFERSAVSYSKGCYLGQEVVTRLKTYGTPKVALAGLLLEGEAPEIPDASAELFIDGARAGRLTAFAWSPTLQQWIALAYMDRAHRTEGDRLQLSDGGRNSFTATVRHLPILQPPTREDYARHLYNEALRHFEQDHDDTDDTAIGLLEDAIHLQPDFEDAYESLGVILHRHHRVDDAIRVMKKLAAMNPNGVMAHTNLSVFYVAKGMIQEAEEEKAIAAQLEFKQELDARQAAKHAEQERERIRAEARERIGMFREVLEIDPEDPVATMGMGTAHMQLEAYEEAIPYLEAAARLQKDYSAAYLQLGKCYEFSGKRAEAVTAYREGIAAAGRKGDLMPMREMERRLKALESQEEGWTDAR
jgi:folate-binding protein YgfZ